MARGLLNLVPISADFGPDRRNIEILTSVGAGRGKESKTAEATAF